MPHNIQILNEISNFKIKFIYNKKLKEKCSEI